MCIIVNYFYFLYSTSFFPWLPEISLLSFTHHCLTNLTSMKPVNLFSFSLSGSARLVHSWMVSSTKKLESAFVMSQVDYSNSTQLLKWSMALQLLFMNEKPATVHPVSYTSCQFKHTDHKIAMLCFWCPILPSWSLQSPDADLLFAQCIRHYNFDRGFFLPLVSHHLEFSTPDSLLPLNQVHVWRFQQSMYGG